jgi:hypothetical protein
MKHKLPQKAPSIYHYTKFWCGKQADINPFLMPSYVLLMGLQVFYDVNGVGASN